MNAIFTIILQMWKLGFRDLMKPLQGTQLVKGWGRKYVWVLTITLHCLSNTVSSTLSSCTVSQDCSHTLAGCECPRGSQGWHFISIFQVRVMKMVRLGKITEAPQKRRGRSGTHIPDTKPGHLPARKPLGCLSSNDSQQASDWVSRGKLGNDIEHQKASSLPAPFPSPPSPKCKIYIAPTAKWIVCLSAAPFYRSITEQRSVQILQTAWDYWIN